MLRCCLSQCIALLLLLLPGIVSNAEDGAYGANDLRRFELGGQISDIRLLPCDIAKQCPTPQLALGPAFAWNVTPHFAVGSAVSFFPSTASFSEISVHGDVLGGRPTEVLFEARASLRARRYSFFLNADPGFISWSKILTGYRLTPTPDGYIANYEYGRGTYFATEVGGGMEATLSSRLRVRASMGDLLIRYTVPSGFASLSLPDSTWVNKLQITGGLYVEMGKRLQWQPATMETRKSHRFFDRTNILLTTASVLGQTADAVTTQRFLSHGDMEGDPLARPFVKYGWPGQIGLGVIANAAELTAAYGFHKMGHHRIERGLPIAIAAASGILAYNNLHGQ